MRVSRFLLACLIVGSSSLNAQALMASPQTAQAYAQQTPEPIKSDPQAIALLAQAVAALQGAATITDVTLSGSARRVAGSDDETGSAVFKAIVDGSSKLTLNLPSGTHSEVRANSDNGPVGSWSGPDGMSHPLAYHNLFTDAGVLPTLLLVGFAKSSAVVSLVGPETRDGANVLHLSAYQQIAAFAGTDPSLSQRLSQTEIFLDATTLLPRAIAFNVHPDNDSLLDIPIVVDFSDYRSVKGAQVPFHIQKSINNSLALDLQLSSAAINTGLSTTDFKVQ